MAWNDAAVAELKLRHEAGQFASEIGRALGYSRNAVIGKISRLKLNAGKPPPDHRTKPQTPRPHKEPAYSEIDQYFKPLPPDPIVPHGAKCCTLLQLTSTTCRWPIGDPKDLNFCFCGDDVAGDDTPYCGYHTRIGRNSQSSHQNTRFNDGPQAQD